MRIDKILRKTLLLLVLTGVALGCKDTSFKDIEFPDKNSTLYDLKYELVETTIKKFPLDEKSAFWHYSMRIDDFDSIEYLSFINEITNSIYLYDNRTKELVKSVDLEREGPDGVGNLLLASHIVLEDGGFIVYNISTGQLFRLNTEGKVIRRYNIRDYKIESSNPNPEPSLSVPIRLVDNKVYIACSIDRYEVDYSQTYTVMVYDLTTESYEFIYPLPEAYNSGYWGSVFKYIPSFDYNNRAEHMVVTFPIDPSIYKMSLDGELISNKYESSEFINEMPPLRENINYGLEKDHNVADIEQKEYSLSTSDFNKIMYDTYNDVYYRVAYIRPTIEQRRSGRRMTSFSVSVLNKDFVKLGEKKFDGLKYRPSMILISKDGLSIGRSDLYSEGEDRLPMSVFNLKEVHE